MEILVENYRPQRMEPFALTKKTGSVRRDLRATWLDALARRDCDTVGAQSKPSMKRMQHTVGPHASLCLPAGIGAEPLQK